MKEARNVASSPDIAPGLAEPALSKKATTIKWSALFGGVILSLIVFVIMPDSAGDPARMTAAVGVLMGCWWITEAIPIPITSMLPLVLFPMAGLAGLSDIATSYANDTVFLFLGGFILALGLERWNLHKRIALNIVLLVGTRPSRLVAGFMIATALLSMWVSNTATAMMMIPMAMSVVALTKDSLGNGKDASKFGVSLVLGVMYAATVGAFGTMLGSPTNLVFVGYVRDTLGLEFTFLDWMIMGVPLMIVMVVTGWIVLTKFMWKPEVDDLPGGRELFQGQLTALGKMSLGEKLMGAVFVTTALSWVFVPILFEDTWASDAVIAMLAAMSLFILPSRPREGVTLMTWGAATNLPWGVLLLFGGGLALSSQITASGLSVWIGDQMGLMAGVPEWLFLVFVVAVLLFLTEFTSSLATAAAFVPVVGSIAVGLGYDPVLLAAGAAMACLCAFMLPVGTPPNAVAFSTGAVSIVNMAKTGIWMNLVSIIAVPTVTLIFVPLLM